MMKIKSCLPVRLISTVLFISSANLLYSQGQAGGPTSVCPNISVDYIYGYLDDTHTIVAFPSRAYYPDGTRVTQSYNHTTNTLTVTWPNVGTGYVTWIYTDGVLVDSTASPITIGSKPIFTTAPQYMCNNQTAIFAISDVCGLTFNWTAPSGWSINGGGNTLSTTSKTVSITAGSGAGQISVASNYSTATSTGVWIGPPVINSISFDGISGPYPLCSGGNITYTANQDHILSTSVSGTTSVTYSLNGPAGIVSGSALSATNFDFFSKSTGANFTITVTASNGCGTITQCLYFSNTTGSCTPPTFTSMTINNGTAPANCAVNVTFQPNVYYTIQAADNTGTPITFSLQNVNGNYATGTVLSSTQFRVRTTNTNSVFRVSATTSNTCGSVGYCIWFSNSGPPDYRIVADAQQGTSPGEDANPSTVSEMTAYPNPANDHMTIAMPFVVKEDTPVLLFDLFGKVIATSTLKTGEWKRIFQLLHVVKAFTWQGW